MGGVPETLDTYRDFEYIGVDGKSRRFIGRLLREDDIKTCFLAKDGAYIELFYHNLVSLTARELDDNLPQPTNFFGLPVPRS